MAAFTAPISTALRVPLLAFASNDHVTPSTGKTIVVTISKNGGAFGNPSAGATNATEVANGLYYVDLSTTDTGTAGPLTVLGTVSGIDNIYAIYQIEDTTIAQTGVNVVKILGTASQGAAGYVAPDWGHVNAPTTTVDLTNTTISTSQVVASVTGAVGSVTAGVTVTTNNDKTGYRLSSAGINDILRTALTEGYAANGVAPTLEQAIFAIQQGLLEFAISGTTLTVKKIDRATTAETYTLDSATAPTSRTRAS